MLVTDSFILLFTYNDYILDHLLKKILTFYIEFVENVPYDLYYKKI